MPGADEPTRALSPEAAARRPCMPVMRALVRAYQAFADYDAAGLRASGLTVPQADVIFTLGNVGELTCKEIGARTLITKGTLTGVLDRLQAKGLVVRARCAQDRRAYRVRLTPEGAAIFAREFPRQIAHLEARFARLDARDAREAERVLRGLRALFE